MDPANVGHASMTTSRITLHRSVSGATAQRQIEASDKRRVRIRRSLFLGLIGTVAASLAGLIFAQSSAAADDVALGRELFSRKWLPNDPRGHGGDGLGPVYNATSCVECHSLGGPGGGGPASQNVELATGIGYSFCGTQDGRQKKIMGRCMATDLVKIHPGFQNARSVVLHRYGVAPEYSHWRKSFLEQVHDAGLLIPDSMETYVAEMNPIRVEPGLLDGVERPPLGRRVVQMPSMASMFMRGKRAGRVVQRVQFSITKRNPPPLFGAGLIDAIPDEALYEVALAQRPAVRGRVHRMKTGQAGRFGWKAQVASLKDFVMSACASELGLEVPGHHQADSPLDPHAMAEARVGRARI